MIEGAGWGWVDEREVQCWQSMQSISWMDAIAVVRVRQRGAHPLSCLCVGMAGGFRGEF